MLVIVTGRDLGNNSTRMCSVEIAVTVFVAW